MRESPRPSGNPRDVGTSGEERLAIGHAYERALFAGRMDELAQMLTEDATYWVAGAPPIGGEWRGRDAVLRAFSNHEFGLGPGDWGYEELQRTWSAADDDRVVVQIHEKSWLRSHPSDVMDQRTCSVLQFRGQRIESLTDYTDSNVYVQFLARHRQDLPKFRT